MENRDVVPLSVPALVKRIPAPVRGLFSSELSAEAIRSAEVILTEAHWNQQLGPVAKMVRRIKEINPRVAVVGGGMTASMFARQLVDRVGFDYVVRGDAEIPLPRLVEWLLDGRGEPTGYSEPRRKKRPGDALDVCA